MYSPSCNVLLGDVGTRAAVHQQGPDDAEDREQRGTRRQLCEPKKREYRPCFVGWYADDDREDRQTDQHEYRVNRSLR